jgi:hypothetical protein
MRFLDWVMGFAPPSPSLRLRRRVSCNTSIAFKNASISVDQIERFYARNLPLSKEMAINLQSFGSES